MVYGPGEEENKRLGNEKSSIIKDNKTRRLNDEETGRRDGK